MASLKALAKSILTRINCLRTGLPYRRGLYIGKGVKIVRPRNMQIDAEARLMPYSMLVAFGPGRIDVGEDSTVSMFSRISSISYVKIGKHVAMGPSCFIADYNHRYDDVNTPIRHQGYSFKAPEPGQPALELCDGCWIGTNVVVVGNVRIGKTV